MFEPSEGIQINSAVLKQTDYVNSVGLHCKIWGYQHVTQQTIIRKKALNIEDSRCL